MKNLKIYIVALKKCLELYRKNNDLKILDKNLENAMKLLKKEC